MSTPNHNIFPLLTNETKVSLRAGLLTVASPTTSKAINGIIPGRNDVVAYHDYVSIFSTDQLTHNQRLSALLDCLIQYNVRINNETCKLGVNRINCLGFVLNTKGIKSDPETLVPLFRVKSPSNLNQLRLVIGAIQYNSRFIPRFAKRASSLFELISSDEFIWTREHEKTLRSLIASIASEAVLCPFSMKLNLLKLILNFVTFEVQTKRWSMHLCQQLR